MIRDRLTSSDYPVGSQLKYRCERGHVLEGGKRVTNRVCTKSGEWTGNEPSCTHVDCLMPDLVDNGEFRLQNNATAYGSMVFYECAVGWKLEGRAGMKTCLCVCLSLLHEGGINPFGGSEEFNPFYLSSSLSGGFMKTPA